VRETKSTYLLYWANSPNCDETTVLKLRTIIPSAPTRMRGIQGDRCITILAIGVHTTRAGPRRSYAVSLDGKSGGCHAYFNSSHAPDKADGEGESLACSPVDDGFHRECGRVWRRNHVKSEVGTEASARITSHKRFLATWAGNAGQCHLPTHVQSLIHAMTVSRGGKKWRPNRDTGGEGVSGQCKRRTRTVRGKDSRPTEYDCEILGISTTTGHIDRQAPFSALLKLKALRYTMVYVMLDLFRSFNTGRRSASHRSALADAEPHDMSKGTTRFSQRTHC